MRSLRAGTWSQVRPRPSGLNPLSFSPANFPPGAPTSGTIIGATPGSVLSFSRPLAGLTINSAERTWTFDGRALPGFGSFLVRETLSGHARDTQIAFSNAPAAVTLGDLSLSSTSFVVGTAASGTIIGAAAGSTIAVTGQPTGFTINSVARTWAYDGTGTAISGSLTLTETLPTLGPKNTVVAYTVSAAAVTLGDLGLSATTFTVGTASSGTITGATAGSVIGVTSAPAGFTINSAARTWAYDGSGSATSGSMTLSETLAGATNTPRSSSVAYTVAAAGGPATLDPAIVAPTVSLISANPDGSSPVLAIGTHETHAVGDTVRLYRRNKAGSLVQTHTNVIDAAEAIDTSLGTQGRADFGLAAVPAGTWRFTADVLKAGGATYGNLSAPVLVIGPDDQEPALSAVSSAAAGATSGKVLFTTDSTGPAKAIFKTANVTPTQTEMDASAFTLTVSAAGPQEITGTGQTASTLYYAFVQQADDTGNKTPITAAGSYTTLAPATSVAKLATANGVNKSQYSTVTSDGFTVSASGDYGAFYGAKSPDAPPPKHHFEAAISGAAGTLYMGVTDAATDFNPAGFVTDIPGNGVRLGSCLGMSFGATGAEVYRNGASATVGISSAWAAGDMVSADVDVAANAITYKRKRVSDGAVETIATVTLTSSIPTNYRAFGGSTRDVVTVTFNFGATAFGVTPLTDHVGW